MMTQRQSLQVSLPRARKLCLYCIYFLFLKRKIKEGTERERELHIYEVVHLKWAKYSKGELVVCSTAILSLLCACVSCICGKTLLPFKDMPFFLSFYFFALI